jgi:hypothetical protein
MLKKRTLNLKNNQYLQHFQRICKHENKQQILVNKTIVSKNIHSIIEITYT